MIKNKLLDFFNIKEKSWYYEYRYFKFKKKFQIFHKFGLNENSIVIDLGSNVGDVTKFISKNYNSTIYSYEPNIHAFNIQKIRLGKNNKIYFFNECVDIDIGEKKIFFHQKAKAGGDAEYSHASSLDPNKSNVSKENYEIVKSTSIQNILDNFDYIDLIKIDIEGYEYKIIPVLIKNKHKINKVICELHGNPAYKNKYKDYEERYNNLIDELNKLNLLNSWFVEWY